MRTLNPTGSDAVREADFMISRISARNFRSLEDVDVLCDPLTAFVGPNGVGKTCLLRAIDLVLGSRWPSMASFQVPEDFTSFDATRDLSVSIFFEPALSHEDVLKKAHEIIGLRLTCRPYKRSGSHGTEGDLHVEFDPLGPKGEPPSVAVGWTAGRQPRFLPLSVGNALRDRVRVLFIDHRRSLIQHLPSARGSILGRLFGPARREFEQGTSNEVGRDAFTVRYQAAMDALRTERMKEVERTVADTAKRMIGFLGSRVLQDVDIRFGFADPANPFTSLRLEYCEGGLTVPGDELGLGVQSAIVVGIFEALRTLGGGVGTVVIEEPEMYLHPQAQRYFYRLLTEMADVGDTQVIYSTHSPIFADAARFESVRLVRRPVGKRTVVTSVSDPDDRVYLNERRDAQKLVTGLNAGRSELFFAHRVLLVEGPGDQLAARLIAGRLGLDLDAEDLAVVECGSKFSIPFFMRVCSALGIGFIVLHDEDIYAEEGDEEQKARIRADNTAHRKINLEIANLTAGDNRVFVVAPTLEAALGIGRSATDKPRRVVEAIRTLPDQSIPEALREAVTSLST